MGVTDTPCLAHFAAADKNVIGKKVESALSFSFILPIRLTFLPARDAERQCDLKNSLRNLIMHLIISIRLV